MVQPSSTGRVSAMDMACMCETFFTLSRLPPPSHLVLPLCAAGQQSRCGSAVWPGRHCTVTRRPWAYPMPRQQQRQQQWRQQRQAHGECDDASRLHAVLSMRTQQQGATHSQQHLCGVCRHPYMHASSISPRASGPHMCRQRVSLCGGEVAAAEEDMGHRQSAMDGLSHDTDTCCEDCPTPHFLNPMPCCCAGVRFRSVPCCHQRHQGGAAAPWVPFRGIDCRPAARGVSS